MFYLVETNNKSSVMLLRYSVLSLHLGYPRDIPNIIVNRNIKSLCLSQDEEFKYEVRRTIQAVVVNLSAKLRDVDFIALSTGQLLTDMTSQLR